MGREVKLDPERRRLLLTTVATSVMTIGLVAFAVSQAQAGSDPGALSTASPTPTATAAPVAACTADQLTTSAGDDGTEVNGADSVALSIVNSASSCTIKSGDLVLDVASGPSGSGATVPLNVDGGLAVLSGGSTTKAIGQFPDPCTDASNSADSAVSVSVYGEARALSGETVPTADASCGTPAFDLEAVTPQDAGTGQYSDLAASIDSVSLTADGSALTYQLTLHNTSKSDFAYRGCPDFTESLTTSSDSVTKRYQLACTAGSSIPAGGSVSYGMEIPLDGAGPVSGRVLWQMDAGPSTASVVGASD